MIVLLFWEGPVSRITAENRRAMATFAAHTQWAWTYSCSGALGVIDGVHIVYKDAAELLPVDKFRALQRAGVWIQVIKDLLSIRAVINHGGWYSDLDIALLPRGLPSGSCFFASEPVRSKLLRYAKQDCDFDHPDYCRGFLNVGIFHFRKGAAFAIKAADAMEAHWLKAVGRAAPPKTTASRWFWNVRRLRKELHASDMQSSICAPMTFMPWPPFLRNFPEKSKQVAGYLVFSFPVLLRSSHTLNLWGRQFSKPFQQYILGLIEAASRPPRAEFWKGKDARPPCQSCAQQDFVAHWGSGRFFCTFCGNSVSIGISLTTRSARTEAATMAAAMVRRKKRRKTPTCRKCRKTKSVIRWNKKKKRWRCTDCVRTFTE